MRLKNSLKLLVGNFKNVYRLLLYKMVIALLATALCYAFVLPEIERLMGSQEMIKLIADTKQFLKAFFSMDADLLAASKEALIGASGSIRQIVKFISGMATEIAWVTLGCVAVFLAKHFLDVLGYFAVGSIVNDKMTTFADTPFFTAYIANLGKASVYSLVYVPVSFLFDAIAVLGVYVFLTNFSIIASMFCSVTFLVVIQALKLTVTGIWMPCKNIDEKLLSKQLFKSANGQKGMFLKTYSNYIISVYAIIIVNVLAVICTFGSALILTIPASYIFLTCLHYVNYYTVSGKRYFLSYEKIESNLSYKDSGEYFENIALESKDVEMKGEND